MDGVKSGQTLTSKQFVDLFTKISDDYSAELSFDGEVTINESCGRLQVARLGNNWQFWLFEYERAYSWKELDLMAQLAATPPELRGGQTNASN